MTIALIDDDAFLAHHNCTQHPEDPRRLEAIRLALSGSQPLQQLGVRLHPREATNAELASVHAPGYISWVDQMLARAESAAALNQLDPDTFLCDGSRRAMYL